MGRYFLMWRQGIALTILVKYGTKYIGRRRLPRGLICIRLKIWHFRTKRLLLIFSSDRFWLEFIKSWKRRAKKSSRESFWFVVLKIWQIRAKNRSEFVKSSKRRTKKLSNYQNEARDWLFEEKIRIRILVRNCQIFKTNAYQVTWKLPPSNGFCQISQYTP